MYIINNHTSTYVFFFKLLQIIVVSVTLACASLGIWGTLLIRQHFDPILLLPADSYLRQWIATSEVHFPQVSISKPSPTCMTIGKFSYYRLYLS